MLDLISIKIPLSTFKKLAYQKAYKYKTYKKAYYQKKKLLKGVIKENNWEGWQKQEERISRKAIKNERNQEGLGCMK